MTRKSDRSCRWLHGAKKTVKSELKLNRVPRLQGTGRHLNRATSRRRTDAVAFLAISPDHDGAEVRPRFACLVRGPFHETTASLCEMSSWHMSFKNFRQALVGQ